MHSGEHADTTSASGGCDAKEAGRESGAADGPKKTKEWWRLPPRPAPSKADISKSKAKKNNKGTGGLVTKEVAYQTSRQGTGFFKQFDIMEHGYWRLGDGSLQYRFTDGARAPASGADEWTLSELYGF